MNDSKQVQISIFPNPADNLINLRFINQVTEDKYLEVNDLNGKKLFGTNLSSDKITLDIEDYPPGIYIIKLRTSKSCIISKFCKM
jgi:hypothetical protein